MTEVALKDSGREPVKGEGQRHDRLDAGVFDEMTFATAAEAEVALERRGFCRCGDDPRYQKFISKPELPIYRHGHPNAPIYSSGRFWN